MTHRERQRQIEFTDFMMYCHEFTENVIQLISSSLKRTT